MAVRIAREKLLDLSFLILNADVHIVEYFIDEGFPVTHVNLINECVRFSQSTVLQLLLAKGKLLNINWNILIAICT